MAQVKLVLRWCGFAGRVNMLRLSLGVNLIVARLGSEIGRRMLLNQDAGERGMKRNLIFLLAFFCFFYFAANSGKATVLAPPDFHVYTPATALPNLNFIDEHTGQITAQSLRGKIVILNVWATWCAPCVRELPSLERLSKQLPADHFAVVPVSQDKGGPAVAQAFLRKIGVNLRSYFDPPGRLYRDLGVRGMPTTFIVDPTGRLLARLEGHTEWDRKDIIAYLLALQE